MLSSIRSKADSVIRSKVFIPIKGFLSEKLKPLNVEWRGKEYWAPYSDEQMKSLVELCKYLCKEFSINTTTLTHNTKINGVSKLEGITYKSNYNELYRDVSPAFDFNYLIENLKHYIHKYLTYHLLAHL